MTTARWAPTWLARPWRSGLLPDPRRASPRLPAKDAGWLPPPRDVATALAGLALVWRHRFPLPVLAVSTAAVVAFSLLGYAYVASLRDRAERDARRQVDEERLRIARELHDVVAHTMATINVQASAAAQLLTDRPEQAGLLVRVTDDGGGATIRSGKHGDLTGADGQPPAGEGGHGLRGIRERAAAAGGTVEIGPAQAGGFQVAARFPGASR